MTTRRFFRWLERFLRGRAGGLILLGPRFKEPVPAGRGRLDALGAGRRAHKTGGAGHRGYSRRKAARGRASHAWPLFALSPPVAAAGRDKTRRRTYWDKWAPDRRDISKQARRGAKAGTKKAGIKPENPFEAGKRRPPRGALKMAFPFILILIALVLFALVKQAEARMLPAALLIADTAATNKLNKAVSNAVSKAMSGIDTAEFCTKMTDDAGKMQSLAANTALINQVCADVADEVSGELINIGSGSVRVPVGSLIGFDILANIGPSYPVSLRPLGNATADYDTKFISAGINQVEYQVWITVAATIRIVNPIQDKDITVTRKLAIVDTVITGDVPQLYVN